MAFGRFGNEGSGATYTAQTPQERSQQPISSWEPIASAMCITKMPKLGPAVCKYYLHWAIWILWVKSTGFRNYMLTAFRVCIGFLRVGAQWRIMAFNFGVNIGFTI